MIVEVIACSLEDVIVARDAGADRVELCLAIEVGGLTPYLETIEQMASVAPFPVVVMIRPRPGAFVGQSDHILEQIRRISSLRLPNIQMITGALNPDNSLDLDAMRTYLDAAGTVSLACHRCFDLTPDQPTALEQLIELGFDRVLTSGGAPNAMEGADTIAALVKQSNGRIDIIAGAGIRPHNVQELIRRTGVDQVHGSCFVDANKSLQTFNFGGHSAVSHHSVSQLVQSARNQF